MKKNAFTLIELLAVIVILAIISLIAVPIVINIINDSKTSSDEQSVELYLDTVEKAITKKQLSNPNFNPDKCEIQDNGDLKCYRNNELIDTLQIEMKGQMPEDGIIKIENNKFKFKNILYNNKIYYESYAKLIQDNNSNGKPDIGDKYSYRVNKTDTFNFYVLSFNDDDTVNLIMDRNICEDGKNNYTQDNNYCRYAWHEGSNNNNYGPDTIMKKLYNATKNWINVPDMYINYVDEDNYSSAIKGYKDIIIDKNTKETKIEGKNGAENTVIGMNENPLKARLPKKDEIKATGCHEYSLISDRGTCPIWLIVNLAYCDVSDSNGSGNTDKYSQNNNTEVYQNIYGYWLLASLRNSNESALNTSICGEIAERRTNYANANGIRPVITVPISDLE